MKKEQNIGAGVMKGKLKVSYPRLNQLRDKYLLEGKHYRRDANRVYYSSDGLALLLKKQKENKKHKY